MPDIDLHKLANEGGYGTARNTLQKAGHWDDHADTGKPREFSVLVRGTAEATSYVKVTARNEDEAVEKAESLTRKAGFEWSDIDITCDYAEVVS